jgi:hypothetical protein
VSGTFAVPVNRRFNMPQIKTGAESISHDGQGLLKPPDFWCQALAFVISSDGRDDVAEGMATVAAYRSAAAEEEVMVRNGGPREGGAWYLGIVRLLNSNRKNERIGDLIMSEAARPLCLQPRSLGSSSRW